VIFVDGFSEAALSMIDPAGGIDASGRSLRALSFNADFSPLAFDGRRVYAEEIDGSNARQQFIESPTPSKSLR
jgi:hypothetical protein